MNAAQRIVFEGGQIALEHFQDPKLRIDWKGDDSPVTKADQLAEDYMRQAIKAAFPKDSTLGEENGAEGENKDWRWIIDPIDGTQSFIHGVPLWGTLLALQHGEEILGGLAYMPALAELVYAAPAIDIPTQWMRNVQSPTDLDQDQNRTAQLSRVESLDAGLWCHTSPDYFVAADCLDLHDELQRRCALTRAWSDCYAFVLLATGRVDLVVEPELNFWDMACFIPMIESLGGAMTDFDGQTIQGSSSVLAASEKLHRECLGLIRNHRQKN